MRPWDDVRPGVPPGASVTSDGVRPSIMRAFTQHTPRVCLTRDDLEALNVLYPDCTGGPVDPVCEKASINIGWLRTFVYLGGPFLVSLLLAILVRYFADRQLSKQAQQSVASEEADQLGMDGSEKKEAAAVDSATTTRKPWMSRFTPRIAPNRERPEHVAVVPSADAPGTAPASS